MKQFLSLECSLYSKGQFQEFSTVMEEYFKMNHAELVPVADLQKPPKEIFYLPMHAVRKEHSSTTKLRVVFDASAKSASGISWNDLLLVGPTVHSPLIANITKRALVSNIAKTYDVLGWFSPAIIKVKILLQQLWEQKVGWDDPILQSILDVWLRWRSELHFLTHKHIP